MHTRDGAGGASSGPIVRVAIVVSIALHIAGAAAVLLLSWWGVHKLPVREPQVVVEPEDLGLVQPRAREAHRGGCMPLRPEARVMEPPPPELEGPPPPPLPTLLAFGMLESSQIAGDPTVRLPDAVLARLRAKGHDKVRFVARLCLDRTGAPSSITFRRPSGFSEVDVAAHAALLRWRFRPYRLGGKRVPVCSTFAREYKISH